MNKQTEEQLSEFFTKKLEEQYHRGIIVGFKTACKSILDTLNDSSKPFVNRVESVKKFCYTPFKDDGKDNKQDEIIKNELDNVSMQIATEDTEIKE